MRKYAYFLALLLIFTIPWEGVVKIRGIGNLATAIGLVVGAFWLITVLTTFQVRTPSLFQLVTCLFVCWNALSIFWSTDPKTTAGQALTWIQLFFMAYIFWDLFTTRAAILGGLQMYVLGAYVAIGGALVNFRHGNVFYTFYQRYSPGDTHPDGFGFALALGIPIAWYLATSDMPTKLSRLLKFVNYAYIPAAFLGLALSGTRTAFIASIVGMVFGIASLTGIRPWARILIVLCLSSIILFMLPRLQTLRSFQRFDTISSELTQGDLNNRTNNWREGFETFLEHPFLGVGGNKYRSVNELYHVAHNSYLSVLVEHGLIGFVLFGGILMISVINAIRQPKRDAMFWLTVFLVWALGAFTLTWEDRKSTWLFLSLITASAALSQPHTENATSSARIASPRRTQGTRKDVPITPSKQAFSMQTRAFPTTGKGRAANRKT